MFVRKLCLQSYAFSSRQGCRKQLILVLGKLSQTLPGIFKGVFCVPAHCSRGLFLPGLVESRHICEEPEALSGSSHMGVSEEMSESESSLALQPTLVKWLCSPENS